jgi:hypothetical protein
MRRNSPIFSLFFNIIDFNKSFWSGPELIELDELFNCGWGVISVVSVEVFPSDILY